MRFFIDAQLPLRLKKWLAQQGHDALHTEDLPKKELTSDIEIIKFAESQNRIVITKDSDFFKHNLITGRPSQILMITTGNLKNKDLIRLFELNFKAIEGYFDEGNSIIEINNNSITIHS